MFGVEALDQARDRLTLVLFAMGTLHFLFVLFAPFLLLLLGLQSLI